MRMPPDTYEALCAAARDDDFDHLGDWLAQLPGLVPRSAGRLEPIGRLGRQLARRRFVVIAGKARTLIEALHELVDYDPDVCVDEAAAAAGAELDMAYKSMKGFMDREAGARHHQRPSASRTR